MKTLIICGVLTAFLSSTVASMSAQTQGTTSSSTAYIEASKIVGTRVKSSDGQEVGTIKDVVLDRNTGCMAYTVVSSAGGGASARGGKMVAVPWAVYSPTSDVSELVVTVDRERIYNAPVFDYARIDEFSRPEYITGVYSYYGVSPGAAVGVGVSGSTTTTTGATTATGAAAGTSTRTGTNPAGAASSPGTASQGAEASPIPRGTPAVSPRATPTGRARPTAPPSTRGEERPTPPTRKMRGERGRSEESSTPGVRGETRSRSETEPSRPEGAGEPEGGTATREQPSEREQSRPEGGTGGQTQTGTHHHEKTGKHQTSSPPERPEGE
jgi:sporulation protein YlmC with PRC-barrel domain